MNEIEKIQKEIKIVEETYIKNAIYLISDYNNENKTRDDYKGRQIYELLQNADDCYNEKHHYINVKITLNNNMLIIQNTGKAFDSRGITSLMHPDASSKYEETIGCKGLGFRSVLNWATKIDIITSEFHVNFSEKRAKERLSFFKKMCDKDHVEELEKIERIAILSSAMVDNASNIRECYLSKDYDTAIVLTCDEEICKIIQNQLIELQFEELLFLKHIQEIIIESPQANRNIKAIKENGICLIQETEKYTEWQLWEKRGFIQQSDGKLKKYELVIAYNEDPIQRDIIRKNGLLYSYFKTDIAMPFPFLIHGTFELTSERNGLIKDNENNRELLSILIDFIAEKGLEISSNGICNYDPLKFLIPSREMSSLDKDYNFTNLLMSKIHKYKIFPTINNQYISLLDNPKYSDIEFDLYLNPLTFDNLLKRCDDEKIKEFIQSKISFYNVEEIVSKINLDADYYVSKDKNIELIKLFLTKYSYSRIAPFLLTDNKGNRITNYAIKTFNNPEELLELPKWGEMCFINPVIENKLRSDWNCDIRYLVNKLHAFGCEEYSFEKVLKELNKQSNNEANKVKSLLNWLFEVWNKNNQKFPSSNLDVDIKIITRDGSVQSCLNCYFGSEYGNEVGERIIAVIETNNFIANSYELGFSNVNEEALIQFLKQLGIKEFPGIKTKKLSVEMNEYMQYNSSLYSTLKTTYKIYSHNTFFNQMESVKVDYIEGIEKILSVIEFSDIMYWILKDDRLRQVITSQNEINDLSCMETRLRYGSREVVGKNQMRCWLRYLFLKSAWLPTFSGKLVNANECTINTHTLSPIIEVVNLDIKKLSSITKINKKELELILEKIGVAQDICDLPKEKIYEILLKLPEIDLDFTIGKKIYTQLNSSFDAEMLNKLITGNQKYEEFKHHGLVLSEKNKIYKYRPTSEVYYVGKKIYSEDILDNYAKLSLNRRVGDTKVSKMFCVQPIQSIGEIELRNIEYHSLNVDYQYEYKKILPYIYAKRIQFDKKYKDLNILKKSNIKLVSSARTIYVIENETKEGILNDYELIYTDRIAYIKIPNDIRTIDELKRKMSFRQAVAEAIATMLDVDGDKDSFLNILSCQSVSEIERYFASDDNMETVNMAKEKFDSQIDFKDEFWNALALTLNCESYELYDKYHTSIGDDFDYKNPNDPYSLTKIIQLLKKLNIDVSDYNKNAFVPLSLIDYYNAIFIKLKNQYRGKYFTYFITKLLERNATKEEFDTEKSSYDFMVIEFDNSINVNVITLFEHNLNVSLEFLNTFKDDFESDLCHLADANYVESPRINQTRNNEIVEKIDYNNLNQKIANVTTEDSNCPIIAANENKKGTLGGRGHSTGINDSTNQNKEKFGFIAESKVYHTLKRRLKNIGTIEWVSGNGEKAYACSKGDDSLGYDIKYSDKNGIHYVEVKGTSSKHMEFKLTKNEFDFAEKNKTAYELWFVFVEDDEPSIPYELGNIMIFENGETFFNNSRFSVEQSEFCVKAKIIEKN